MRQSLKVWVLIPSFRCGKFIHECQRLSHGRRQGWLLSFSDARTFVPLCVRASIVPQQTCVSFEFFGRATYLGTKPRRGHSAQQSGCSAGSCICTIFRFGIIIYPFCKIGYFCFLSCCFVVFCNPLNTPTSAQHSTRRCSKSNSLLVLGSP